MKALMQRWSLLRDDDGGLKVPCGMALVAAVVRGRSLL